MGRRASTITFRRSDYKLVMARTEIRKDNGDLEVPPRLFWRVDGAWHLVDWWGNLPDCGAVRGLVNAMKARRAQHEPKFRNPVPPHDPFFDAWPL